MIYQETVRADGINERLKNSGAEFFEVNKKTGDVIEAFESFNLKFDIKDHPDLLERLADIGPHFRAAVEMAAIIDRLWEKFGLEDEGRENMIVATLLHDIGMSGPKDFNFAESELREMFGRLFSNEFIKSESKTLGDLAQETGVLLKEDKREGGGKGKWFEDLFSEDQKEKYSGLFLEERRDERRKMKESNFRINENMKADDFCNMRVDWTHEILSEEPDLDPEVVKIASSPYILEGKNPMQLKEEEIPDQAKALEITNKRHLLVLAEKLQNDMRVAKGQAYEPASYKEIIKELTSYVDSGEISDEAKQYYYDIITVFAENEDAVEDALAKKTLAA